VGVDGRFPVKTFRLFPRGALRLGSEEGSGLRRHGSGLLAPSDGLLSALGQAVRSLFGRDAVEDYAGLVRDGAVALSSALPTYGERLLLPAPGWPVVPGPAGSEGHGMAPRFVEAALVAEALEAGGWPGVSKEMEGDEAHQIAWRAPRPSVDARWAIGWRFHVVLDRPTHRSGLYGAEEVRPPPGFALALALDAPEEWSGRLERALGWLGTEGLGGDRSRGGGGFEVEPWEAPVPFLGPRSNHGARPGEAVGFLLLSRMFPGDGDWELLRHPASAWTVEEVGGWVEPPTGPQVRKKKVRMIREGAWFPRPPHGESVDVTPDGFLPYRVFRGGAAVATPYPGRPEERG